MKIISIKCPFCSRHTYCDKSKGYDAHQCRCGSFLVYSLNSKVTDCHLFIYEPGMLGKTNYYRLSINYILKTYRYIYHNFNVNNSKQTDIIPESPLENINQFCPNDIMKLYDKINKMKAFY